MRTATAVVACGLLLLLLACAGERGPSEHQSLQRDWARAKNAYHAVILGWDLATFAACDIAGSWCLDPDKAELVDAALDAGAIIIERTEGHIKSGDYDDPTVEGAVLLGIQDLAVATARLREAWGD